MRTLEAPLHFVCQIGHAYSPLALGAAQANGARGALDAAYRGLRERAMLEYMTAEGLRARRAHADATLVEGEARRLEGVAEQVRALQPLLLREELCDAPWGEPTDDATDIPEATGGEAYEQPNGARTTQ